MREAIVLIDTCVVLNFMNVPGYNQNRIDIRKELAERYGRNDKLFLPMATVLETGSHIADIPDGNRRRKWAKDFAVLVTRTYREETPWRSLAFPKLEEIVPWLVDFPEYALQGIGFADMSIIKAWEEACDNHPMSRVQIWSLDKHLKGYDRKP